MKLMWVAEQRLVIKALGRRHLMTRQKQRSLRRSGVKGKRKDWGGVCQNSEQESREGNVQEGLCRTGTKHAILDLSVKKLSRTLMNS